ncbi:hypothetical protein Q8A67_018015 [Cirrhinus molitorella]|uniref:Uncharacterized protein n=1 Tax=Cirrhinus molitorella TaxID=172907 RepID=A0AA88PFL6_9TELE|nr:hypothetical protein Q8A67_018015 [Cirrhinus molitorella]
MDLSNLFHDTRTRTSQPVPCVVSSSFALLFLRLPLMDQAALIVIATTNPRETPAQILKPTPNFLTSGAGMRIWKRHRRFNKAFCRTVRAPLA